MKTIAEILKKAKMGDVLTAGRRKWVVIETDWDGCVIARPANKYTKFELWSSGIENVAVIPGLKVVQK